MKTKRIAKFGGLEPRRCEDIKEIVAPEINLKSFGTFQKQAPSPIVQKHLLRSRRESVSGRQGSLA